MGWKIKFCEAETDAGRVVVQSGRSPDDNAVWMEWIKGVTPNLIDFPPEQRDLGNIYVQLNNPEEEQIEACIVWDSSCKYRFSFDGENERESISTEDTVKRCPC